MENARCVACGRSGAELCSYGCLEASMREREDNVARLHQLGDTPTSRALRHELELRNGQITSALMSWRQAPSVSEAGQA